MTLETDALAETAARFSEAIRAERTSTFDALASERQAALKIIESLRAERARGTQQAGARFVLGVALGAAAGIAAIYFVSQRASEEARLGLTAAPVGGFAGNPDGGPSIGERFRQAIDDGRRAMQRREDELWQQYRQRGTTDRQPRADDLLY